MVGTGPRAEVDGDQEDIDWERPTLPRPKARESLRPSETSAADVAEGSSFRVIMSVIPLLPFAPPVAPPEAVFPHEPSQEGFFLGTGTGSAILDGISDLGPPSGDNGGEESVVLTGSFMMLSLKFLATLPVPEEEVARLCEVERGIPSVRSRSWTASSIGRVVIDGTAAAPSFPPWPIFLALRSDVASNNRDEGTAVFPPRCREEDFLDETRVLGMRTESCADTLDNDSLGGTTLDLDEGMGSVGPN